MSTPPPGRQADPPLAFPDRRQPVGPVGSLSWLKSLFGRPLWLTESDGIWKLVLGERRAPPPAPPPSLNRQRDELRERLLAHTRDPAAAGVEQLEAVYGELCRKGWPGVERMSPRLLGRALHQARRLAGGEAGEVLGVVIERLQVIHAAAQLREQRQARLAAPPPSVEVAETTRAAFDEATRSAADSPPPGRPVPPGPPDPEP